MAWKVSLISCPEALKQVTNMKILYSLIHKKLSIKLAQMVIKIKFRFNFHSDLFELNLLIILMCVNL